jgi:hypothetical protein
LKRLLLSLLVLVGTLLPANATTTTFKKSFLAQTGNITTTTIYTPTVAKDCDVSIYITAQTVGLNPPINGVTWQWTDDFSNPQGATSYGVFVTHQVANTALTFSLNAGTFAGTYNVYIVGFCD